MLLPRATSLARTLLNQRELVLRFTARIRFSLRIRRVRVIRSLLQGGPRPQRRRLEEEREHECEQNDAERQPIDEDGRLRESGEERLVSRASAPFRKDVSLIALLPPTDESPFASLSVFAICGAALSSTWLRTLAFEKSSGSAGTFASASACGTP